MGLVKTSEVTAMSSASKATQHGESTGYTDLMAQVNSGEPAIRRQAIRMLRHHPKCLADMIELAKRESDKNVVESIFDTLLSIASCDNKVQEVISGVVELMFSRDTQTRNQAIVFLSDFPAQVAQHIPHLLSHENRDIRLYTLDIIRGLAHPEVPSWLASIIDHEEDANVLVSAIDRAAESGCVQLMANINMASIRIENPMVQFAVVMATTRLGGVQ